MSVTEFWDLIRKSELKEAYARNGEVKARMREKAKKAQLTMDQDVNE